MISSGCGGAGGGGCEDDPAKTPLYILNVGILWSGVEETSAPDNHDFDIK